MITIKVTNETDIPKVAETMEDSAYFLLNALSAVAEQKAKSEAPVGVSGTLKSSIQPSRIERTRNGHRQEVGPNVPYGICVEHGTEPHFPPPEALELWVKRKLGVPVDQVKRVAFAVAKTISRHGTKAQPFLAPAFDESNKALGRLLRKAERMIHQ